MIYVTILMFLLVDLYGTEHKSLEVYSVDTFMNTIRQIDENARKVENKCYNKNILNQNIYISLALNKRPNNTNIISVYDMVLQNYKKIIKFEPLSVLTVEIVNKNIKADHNISQQIFQCYCNIISNLVDGKKTYNFKNRFFYLKYSHKNLTDEKELKQIMQPSIYTMVIFENCIDNIDDVTLLYKSLKSVANAIKGYLSQLQIVFALKFNNIGEIDEWNKLDLLNKTLRPSTFGRCNSFNYLNLNLAAIKKEGSKIKIRCNVQFYNNLFYLISGYRMIRKNGISTRKKDAEMIFDEKNNTFVIENATNPCENTDTFIKSVASGHFYQAQVFNYVKNFYFIFVITSNPIKNNIMYYKKCISIYLYREFEQKLICRYCYITESSQNSNRVIKLIDSGQKFISFKRNFLSYIETPFQKFSDYLPFSLTINSSEYLHWYVDDSFYVNQTNLSNIISYECVIKLKEMLGDSRNDNNIIFLNASIKNFTNQINCDNIYNIFDILTINNKLTQNSLTPNNFKEFEIFIIAIKNVKSIYYNSYLVFPIKAYNKIYLISLLNKTWNLFLSRVCFKAEKNNSLQYKTLLHKHVCAKIIFTHYSDNFKELEIDTIIKHIQLEKRIHIYIMLYDSMNILNEKNKYIVRHFFKDYESYNDERHFLRSVKYLTLMLSYSKKKVFIAKVDFYRNIIISFCNTLKEQHNLLTKNKTNMIWYYHTKNSIDVNQYSSLIFDKVNDFFNTYIEKTDEVTVLTKK